MKRINWEDTNIKSRKTYSAYYEDKQGNRVYVVKGGTFREANGEASLQRLLLGHECTLVED